MSELPPKPSMAHYAKEALRQLLSKGEWSGRLPGERTLALRIGVSRPTLHQALLELEADGIVARRLKSAWRIIVENPKSLTGKRLVVFISPISLEDLDHFTLHQFTVFSAHLAERGYEGTAVEEVATAIILPSATLAHASGTWWKLEQQGEVYRVSEALAGALEAQQAFGAAVVCRIRRIPGRASVIEEILRDARPEEVRA